jgi:hypothetical protein
MEGRGKGGGWSHAAAAACWLEGMVDGEHLQGKGVMLLLVLGIREMESLYGVRQQHQHQHQHQHQQQQQQQATLPAHTAESLVRSTYRQRGRHGADPCRPAHDAGEQLLDRRPQRVRLPHIAVAAAAAAVCSACAPPMPEPVAWPRSPSRPRHATLMGRPRLRLPNGHWWCLRKGSSREEEGDVEGAAACNASTSTTRGLRARSGRMRDARRGHAASARKPCCARQHPHGRAPTRGTRPQPTLVCPDAQHAPRASLLCIPHRVELRRRGAARQAHHVARAAPRHHLPCSGYQPHLQRLLSVQL